MQTPKRKRYHKDTAPTDDIITLISLVRQNPALYNYKLQPNQRRRVDVLNGWAEIAVQIGNKYTVEECRRKWKNLRDTYHQYRLRKPKLGDGLSKWRYAKELEFLSNVYQPKLKSQRHHHYESTGTHHSTTHHLHGGATGTNSNTVKTTSHMDDDAANSIVHHGGSSITLVNDDENFILTAYEEGVSDDVTAITDHGAGDHDDPNMGSHMELTHDDHVEDVEEIVKHEIVKLDDATGAEVDYEEVCMYEEATANGQSVDCETIIGGTPNNVARSASTDTKVFQYIDTNDFCIESIPQLSSSSNSVIGSTKLKNVNVGGGSVSGATTATIVTTPVTSTLCTNNASPSNSNIASIFQLQAPANPPAAGQIREELDLFFDFLKKKIQCFSKEEITGIQVEFLNCVLRREAENAQKTAAMWLPVRNAKQTNLVDNA